MNALTWDYPTEGPHDEPVVEQILQEINGRKVADANARVRLPRAEGRRIDRLRLLDLLRRLSRSRDATARTSASSRDYLGHGWGFAWPADRRILYNRASARPDGSPWSERKKLVWWDGAKREWTGLDVPDFTPTKAPDYRATERRARATRRCAATRRSSCTRTASAGSGSPSGLQDGPLPTHYEPLESPFANALYPAHATNPPADKKERPDNAYVPVGDARFPHVLTTYRLTEHHTAGGMSRYAVASRGAAAGVLLRDLARARARDRRRATATG